jgi:hypothetical protein
LGTSKNLLRDPIAVLDGARSITYLFDMFRSLSSFRPQINFEKGSPLWLVQSNVLPLSPTSQQELESLLGCINDAGCSFICGRVSFPTNSPWLCSFCVTFFTYSLCVVSILMIIND